MPTEAPPPTVLIVDDDPVNLEVLATLLRRHGYRVLQALDGRRAHGIAAQARPDVVLLDVQMPGPDGYDTCRAIRAEPGLEDTSVLFVSAQREVEHKVRGFAAGGVDYIDKPFHHDELLSRVGTHVDLRRARLRLRQQNEEIEGLLHILSHDLMNPVSAIQGFVRLAALHPAYDEPENRSYWELVAAAARQQEAIIHHVREMRALELGKRKLNLVPVNVEELMELARALLSEKLERKALGLSIRLGGRGGPLWVMADPVSLTHNVLTNLLSNAIKFSYRGSQIRVSAEPAEDMVHLCVEDHGIGMPAALIEEIFRTDRPTSRPGTEDETGTGFGMPLVHKHVELLGGRMSVESRSEERHPDDHGTRVHLWLRQALEEEAGGAAGAGG